MRNLPDWYPKNLNSVILIIAIHTAMELIIIGALAGTTAMTIFSYAISASFRKLYKEPLLLQFVISRLGIQLNGNTLKVLAWAIHYAIGIFFAIGYHYAVAILQPDNPWLTAALFGGIIGILGIIGWKTMFALSGKPRQTDAGGYYAQLFIAHVIFAAVVVSIHAISDVY